MLRDIELEIRATRSYIGRERFSEPVMRALREVPREHFVPEDLRELAYRNGPLPIGYGQTISQPYIVALMTELLGLDAHAVVLEVGTGSAYQAAILSRLVSQVYTIEIVEPLAKSAEERLHRLGYANVTVRAGDGYAGWPEHAPFDAIIVTAAADHIPPPLVAQLKAPGRMAIPLGAPFQSQWLTLLRKDPQGAVSTEDLLPVAFVPLTGDAGRGLSDAEPRTSTGAQGHDDSR
jgi:protein-L-isoaspartate(D-aspartate) O-methyltransferase